MWPSFRGYGVDGKLRRNPFDDPHPSRLLRLTLDHLLEGSPSDALRFLEELIQLDEFLLMRLHGSYPALGGGTFEFPPVTQEDSDPTATAIVRPDANRTIHLYALRWPPDPPWTPPEVGTSDALFVMANQALALAAVSFAAGSDILVTGRVFSHEMPECEFANPVSVHEALAVMGLFMRASGWATLDAKIVRTRYDLRLAEKSEARRAMSSVFRVAREGDDLQWTRLLDAVIERMTRVLRARDQVTIDFTLRHESPFLDPVLAVEAAATAFVAALDALARAVNDALGLGLSPQKCSWTRKDGLLKRLPTTSPRLSTIVANPAFASLLGLVGEIRNCVHAEPLGRARWTSGAERGDSLVEVPPLESAKVREHAKNVVTSDRWIVDTEGPYLAIEPVPFVHDLAVLLPSLCNAIVDSIDWPSTGESASVSDAEGPTDERYEIQNGWLYGLRIWADPRIVTSLELD